MTRWEYKRICYANDETLARMGEDGWELVAVTSSPSGDGYAFYWKRPKDNLNAGNRA